PVVVMAGAAGDAPDMVRALHAAGVTARLFVHDDASYLAQDAAMARELAGVRYLTFYVANERGAGEEAWFVRTFRERFGTAPDGRDAFSYEATTVLAAAVRAVGPDRHKVRDWIAQVGRSNPPLPGITGPIRFNENRTAQGKRVWIGEVGS
ncbi:MAG TPA: ABC transporter substrate-binding protein, partial [Longimicrobiales bacterium]